MQIHCKYTGVKGFVKLYEYGLKWLRMITDKAKYKAEVLSFWGKYGLQATEEAFGAKERTLYLWKNQLKQGEGNLESLNDKSKRPKTVRCRRFEWPSAIKDEIKRIRKEHPNLGKDKIYPFLFEFCNEKKLACPKPATIGNLIKDMGGLRIFPTKVRHDGQIVRKNRAKKIRKPKGFNALYPGHCIAFDTIEKIIYGNRRYILTFTDLYSRMSLAWATNSHTSKTAKEFLDLVKLVFPFRFEHVLTDNGSEFMKYFDIELQRMNKAHWHTYPRTPKMNAHAERFNRTIQEEYIDYHEHELLDTRKFNVGLMKQLIWHNTQRPHHSLNNLPPAKFIQINNNFPKYCNMYLTYTKH